MFVRTVVPQLVYPLLYTVFNVKRDVSCSNNRAIAALPLSHMPPSSVGNNMATIWQRRQCLYARLMR